MEKTFQYLTLTSPAKHVALITFNRPEKLNALSETMQLELFEALDIVEQDSATRVVMFTGSGNKAFVAGADINEYRGLQIKKFNDYQLKGREAFERIEQLPKPTIALVNGFAMGGGFEIALSCDLLIASDNAQMGLPEGLLGLCPGGGGTQRLLRAVGKAVTMDVLLSGKRIKADEALRLGLASQICSQDALFEEGLKKASYLLKVSPVAQASMKKLVRNGFDTPLESGLSWEQASLLQLYCSEDGQEGVAAFLDKRTPAFDVSSEMTSSSGGKNGQ
ncbi:enoyl-CoA hydratase/isomerase family protein [Vibrio nigripulchritudo]|uniref:enoyl-CoA hydratase/isomerase family protein n=1 Tax=Vibrio nigripulchritudo TaxID=28173 RepID=UPI0003B1EEDB|nr:enoyl-CoA hydratase/isomerase family protein [Vibrio nigripulchritudo]CCN70498.1 putative Enoyl-CoA hydratase [Vibrio nigripulchritudo SFn118]